MGKRDDSVEKTNRDDSNGKLSRLHTVNMAGIRLDWHDPVADNYFGLFVPKPVAKLHIDKRVI